MRPIPSAWILSVVLPAVLLGAGATPGAGAADATPLPDDPALVRGALANGLRYVLLRHGNPEGRIGIWLHVASGSLNETEEQRGIAHYLEHMAFNGSQHFPPGSLVPFFESLGMSFGRDQNAFTGFDQTTYMLALPDGREEWDRQHPEYLRSWLDGLREDKRALFQAASNARQACAFLLREAEATTS